MAAIQPGWIAALALMRWAVVRLSDGLGELFGCGAEVGLREPEQIGDRGVQAAGTGEGGQVPRWAWSSRAGVPGGKPGHAFGVENHAGVGHAQGPADPCLNKRVVVGAGVACQDESEQADTKIGVPKAGAGHRSQTGVPQSVHKCFFYL